MQSLRFKFVPVGDEITNISERLKGKINHLAELEEKYKIQSCSITYKEIPKKISLAEYEEILDFIEGLYIRTIDCMENFEDIPSLDDAPNDQ